MNNDFSYFYENQFFFDLHDEVKEMRKFGKIDAKTCERGHISH